MRASWGDASTKISRDEDCCDGDVLRGGGRRVVDCIPFCVEEVSTALVHASVLQAHG